jgi:hypothetical protein
MVVAGQDHQALQEEPIPQRVPPIVQQELAPAGDEGWRVKEKKKSARELGEFLRIGVWLPQIPESQGIGAPI